MRYQLLPLALVALSLAACQPAAAPSAPTTDTAETLKMGVIGALTGDVAALGVDALAGAKMAVDEANAAGGINGKQIDLVIEDGKCSSADAASAAQKLVNVDKVSSILVLCSSEVLGAAPITEAAKVVVISSGASSPDVTTAGDYIFRNYPSDAGRTKAMAKYFADEGLKRVAIISENTDYSQALKNSLKANLPAGAVVFDESVGPGTKDYRSLLARLKKVDFDSFFTNANSDALNAIIIQQFREQGFTQTILGADTTDSVLVPQTAGKAAEGVMIVDVPTEVSNPQFVNDFKARNGEPKSTIIWPAFAFDATNVLIEAMKAVGTDGTAIKDYLYSMPPYAGVVGTFSFDVNGDPVGISYVLKAIKDGKIVTVKPL